MEPLTEHAKWRWTQSFSMKRRVKTRTGTQIMMSSSSPGLTRTQSSPRSTRNIHDRLRGEIDARTTTRSRPFGEKAKNVVSVVREQAEERCQKLKNEVDEMRAESFVLQSSVLRESELTEQLESCAGSQTSKAQEKRRLSSRKGRSSARNRSTL